MHQFQQQQRRRRRVVFAVIKSHLTIPSTYVKWKIEFFFLSIRQLNCSSVVDHVRGQQLYNDSILFKDRLWLNAFCYFQLYVHILLLKNTTDRLLVNTREMHSDKYNIATMNLFFVTDRINVSIFKWEYY